MIKDRQAKLADIDKTKKEVEEKKKKLRLRNLSSCRTQEKKKLLEETMLSLNREKENNR
jgi:hypothetical protein